MREEVERGDERGEERIGQERRGEERRGEEEHQIIRRTQSNTGF